MCNPYSTSVVQNFMTYNDVLYGGNYPRMTSAGLEVLVMLQYSPANQLCTAAAGHRRRREIIGENDRGVNQELAALLLTRGNV